MSGKAGGEWDSASGVNMGQMFCFVLLVEDCDRQRVSSAVRDGLADQRVVQHHPECHRQAGEKHTLTQYLNPQGCVVQLCVCLSFAFSYNMQAVADFAHAFGKFYL